MQNEELWKYDNLTDLQPKANSISESGLALGIGGFNLGPVLLCFSCSPSSLLLGELIQEVTQREELHCMISLSQEPLFTEFMTLNGTCRSAPLHPPWAPLPALLSALISAAPALSLDLATLSTADDSSWESDALVEGLARVSKDPIQFAPKYLCRGERGLSDSHGRA